MKSKVKAATSSALEEAMAIAREAEYAAVDWTQNPENDREAELRAAAIAHIKNDEAEREARSKSFLKYKTTHVALHTLTHLESLVDFEAEIIGADLYDAIEKWQALHDQEKAANAAIERRRLFEGARKQMGSAESKPKP
ncbi:MAG TPA: hypothetical protein VHX17_12025 [Candidatus Cybelea sp.]|jgi:nicotinic acid mononucleotide adenylyltransferase|nr:hypothetical protein [Candidatus Cybelea sp.]